MRALEMAIQTEFGINEGMSTDAWEAVLDEVISRSKRYHSFHTQSPESVAMDSIIRYNPKLIEASLPQTAVPRHHGSLACFFFWAKPFNDLPRSYAEFLPLEYAVLKSRPPASIQAACLRIGAGRAIFKHGRQLLARGGLAACSALS